MKKSKLTARIVATILALVTVIPILSLSTLGASENNLDYSRPGSLYTKELSAPEIIESILDTTVSEAERKYLISYSDTVLRYDDGIPTYSVLTEYDNGTLRVCAYEYSYLTADGANVCWIPTAATLNGETKVLVKSSISSYDTEFTSVSDADDSAVVNISYKLDVTVTADYANYLINMAYFDAVEFKAEKERADAAYEAAKIKYDADKAAYDEYVEKLIKHGEDVSLHLGYLSSMRSYEAALDKHNEYLAAKKAFDAAVITHNQYLDDMKEFEEKYAEFSDYLSEYRDYQKAYDLQAPDRERLKKCQDQLAIINATKTQMTSYSRTVYGAVVQSELVDYVLSQRDLYSSSTVNMSEAVVDLAEESTALLRRLLPEYFSLETEIARYNYYSANYDDFCDGFLGLFQSLYYMAQNKKILGGILLMKDQETLDKFEILIAQLYIICDALVDGKIYSVPAKYVASADKSYKQYEVTYSNFKIKRNHSAIMENKVYLTDTDAAKPVSGGFPTIVELIPPTPVAEPKQPAYVPKPIEPDYVAHPGDPPAFVADPGDPPEPVDEPTEPTPVSIDGTIADLIDALGDEVVYRGTPFNEDAVIRVESVVSKRFINVSTFVVKFYATGGSDPDYSVVVDSGSFADYLGPVPNKAEDVSAVYRFSGWQTENGEVVDLSAVDRDLILYPYFVPVTKYYTVTWQIGNISISEGLPYGATPQYTGVPRKPSDEKYGYTFIGWSPEIDEVSCDVTYTAIFESYELIPTAPGVTVTPTEDGYVLDATRAFATEFDLTHILMHRESDDNLVIITGFAEMTLDPIALECLQEHGAVRLSLETFNSGYSREHYSIRTYSFDGTENACPDVAIRVKAYTNIYNPDRLCLRFENSEGAFEKVRFTNGKGYIEFSARLGVEYTLGNEYVVTAVSGKHAEITTVNDGYLTSDTVNVNVLLAPGRSLTKLYYRDTDGNEHLIYGKSFTMPESDVTIIAVTDTSFHTVKFMSDGKVVTSYQLAYGKIPTPPAENPKKASDGDFTYTFVGWSPDFDSPITGNVTFHAVYEATPVIRTDKDQPVSIYKILLIAVASLCVCLLVGVVVMAVVVIRRMSPIDRESKPRTRVKK